MKLIITLVPKPDKDITRKENCTPISLTIQKSSVKTKKEKKDISSISKGIYTTMTKWDLSQKWSSIKKSLNII